MPPHVRRKVWTYEPVNEGDVRSLAQSLGTSEACATVLVRRGQGSMDAAKLFLAPEMRHLHDPFLMRDMDRAVERILSAIAARERILIYGDYDVDGTTAVVILKKALEFLGAAVNYYIPVRLVDGYGMRDEPLERAREEGHRLIISVDCGIRSHSVVETARRIGLDVIITDHHLPETDLPKALAILNPQRTDCEYPEKILCGAGVAFKLAQALFLASNLENSDAVIASFLKIAAIGTIADVVPLVRENRVIVRCGLEGLARPRNRGLEALLEVCDLLNKPIRAEDVAFRIAPRINAAGRMAVAQAVVELFSTVDRDHARALATQLNAQNQERQRVEGRIIEEILTQLEADVSLSRDLVIVLASEGWHRGVIGIAASRIAERLHRPVVIISIENGIGHGSGRSIAGFHLLDGLASCSELFERFGGHSHAAGLAIKADRIPALRSRLNEYATRVITAEDLTPTLPIDALVPLSAVDLTLLSEVQSLEPFGQGNPMPVFVAKDVTIAGDPRVLKERHLKFRGMHHGRALDCIWWGGAELASDLFAGDKVHLAYTLGENTYNGIRQLQITVKDLKGVGEPVFS